MNTSTSRREFLADVGRGMLVAGIGAEIARDLGLASSFAAESPEALTFGDLESLVCLMQETPASQLLPVLVKRLHAGDDLRRLTAAAALANARTFGGEDYIGYHTFMALSPAFRMAQELPEGQKPLPVLKVLYRNSNRIQERGGRKNEVLHCVKPSETAASGEKLRDLARGKNMRAAEQTFAALARTSPEDAFNALLTEVQDDLEVHRVVLPYRAWDLLDVIGKDQAHALLRQSVRYCVNAESWSRDAFRNRHRTLLPKLLEEHKLLARSRGDRQPDDAWIDQLSQTFFKSSPEDAAAAAAGALAEGFSPIAVGQALSLCANQLVLRDHGRPPREESLGKPPGSVHGDSIGVHACDSVNAWRNMANVSNPRNCFASLILGAFQVANDRTERGGDFQNWEPLPVSWHLKQVQSTEQESLLRDMDEAIRGNLQARATAVAQRYGELGHAERPLFDLLLRYAISEDGALHAEKFYRTTVEEFRAARPAFRWRYVVALARVTASEYGRPAPGISEARSLLRV